MYSNSQHSNVHKTHWPLARPVVSLSAVRHLYIRQNTIRPLAVRMMLPWSKVQEPYLILQKTDAVVEEACTCEPPSELSEWSKPSKCYERSVKRGRLAVKGKRGYNRDEVKFSRYDIRPRDTNVHWSVDRLSRHNMPPFSLVVITDMSRFMPLFELLEGF